jgi:hypothetical protein
MMRETWRYTWPTRQHGEAAHGAEEQGEQSLLGARSESQQGILSSEKRLKAVLKMHCDLLVNLGLKIIIDQIRSLNRSIAELEETIGKQGEKVEGHKNLTSIKGIGGLTGGILSSIIGDIGDFADEGKLAAYFGIVPRVSNSNETERCGRITPTRDQVEAHHADSIRPNRAMLQPLSENLLRKDEEPTGHREGDRRPGAQIPGNHRSSAEEQVGVRRLP